MFFYVKKRGEVSLTLCVHVCICEQGQLISLRIGDGEDVSSGVIQQPSLHIKAVRREEAEGRGKGWMRDRK